MVGISLHSIKKINPNEQFVHVIHRHWFNILQQFFIFLIALFLIGTVYFMVKWMIPEMEEKELYPLFVFIENTFLLAIWIYAFLIWIDYYFDVWIVTTDRVINIEQKGLFHREIHELPIVKIQTVTTEVRGILPSMLNFGDLFVSTASEEDSFLFRAVPDPNRIRTEIMDIRRKSAEIHERI